MIYDITLFVILSVSLSLSVSLFLSLAPLFLLCILRLSSKISRILYSLRFNYHVSLSPLWLSCTKALRFAPDHARLYFCTIDKRIDFFFDLII